MRGWRSPWKPPMNCGTPDLQRRDAGYLHTLWLHVGDALDVTAMGWGGYGHYFLHSSRSLEASMCIACVCVCGIDFPILNSYNPSFGPLVDNDQQHNPRAPASWLAIVSLCLLLGMCVASHVGFQWVHRRCRLFTLGLMCGFLEQLFSSTGLWVQYACAYCLIVGLNTCAYILLCLLLCSDTQLVVQ
jgi:hypothetical protein